MTSFLRPYLLALAASLVAAPAFAQPPAAPAQSLPALVTESQKLLRDGHLDDAMASAKKAVATLPDSAPAHLQLGIVLDITGHYAEAREHLTMARDKSAAPQDATRASRAIAVSYAFEGNCAGATSVESPLVDHAVSAGDFTDAGEIANELARICLESGDVAQAHTKDEWIALEQLERGTALYEKLIRCWCLVE